MEIFKYHNANPSSMERPISFFAMLFILLFAGISFIFVVFGLYGFSFVFELGLLLAFMFVLTFAMFLIYNNKNRSWGIIAAVMMLLLFDVFIIFLVTRAFTLSYISTTLFAIAGMVVALINAIPQREHATAYRTENNPEKIYSKQKYYYPLVDRKENLDEAAKEEVKQELKPEIKREVKQELMSELKIEVKDLEGNGVIARTQINKEKGYLYFLDENGDVSRVKMARRGQKTSKLHELIAKAGVERKKGYLYFIDKNGNISQAKMARKSK